MWSKLLLVAAVTAAAACGDTTAASTGGRSTTITVADNTFRPTPDTVSAGQVTFMWTGANQHNVIWDTGPGTRPANSSGMTGSGTYQATLQTGTYTYHCGFHAAVMTGRIVVQ
jgi:plastocyanin